MCALTLYSTAACTERDQRRVGWQRRVGSHVFVCAPAHRPLSPRRYRERWGALCIDGDMLRHIAHEELLEDFGK